MAKARQTVLDTLQNAVTLHQAGDIRSAAQLYRRILNNDPRNSNALRLLGLIRLQEGDLDQAERLISKAIEQNSKQADAHYFLGRVFYARKRLDRAILCLKKCVEIDPNNDNALTMLACIEAEAQNDEGALQFFKQSLATNPLSPDAWYNYAVFLNKLCRHDEALVSCQRAIAIKPSDAELFAERGLSLHGLRRYNEALASYDHALALKPDSQVVLVNRGVALMKLRRYDEAIAYFDRAIALNSDHADAFANRGIALRMMRRYGEALICCDKALAIKPDHVHALYSRGLTLLEVQRYDEALIAFTAVRQLDPTYKYALGALIHCKMHVCDWSGLTEDIERLSEEVRQGKCASEPFTLLAACSQPSEQLLCAQTFVADRHPPAANPLYRSARNKRDRMRLAYVSGEFREQATSWLTAELFEVHDRTRFETFAISTGFNDHSPMRSRLEAAFDVFIDGSNKPDSEIADQLFRSEIDIAVNLNGHFGIARTDVFALRPCPIQINYLGYPGTMGAEYMDYIIADRCVIPEDQRAFYTEKVVYLPDTYQANDSKKYIADQTQTRSEAGLPETSFVFCCFNNNHKIMPEMFDVWCRLLKQVDSSVLWLMAGNTTVERNLHYEARRRGLPPERIVFAPRMKLQDHLARHRLADLFIDALPHNAHTTSSDALWAGLPVLTCLGSTFAGRVAGSLLQAVGLPELITHSLEEYETLALRLAREPSLLASIKSKLARHRNTHPLFDTDRLRRHIESAYITMWERYQRGDPPTSFAVDTIE
jgi:protein O-GlcNAc transferase